jgi:primase-polymerase (primpol)-like protein
MHPVVEVIPGELKDWAQWVVWRYQRRGTKWTKPPYCPGTGELAQVDHPATWGTYAEAYRAWKHGTYAGLAFVVSACDPYTVIDLDHCIENGQITRRARTIVDHFASYTEWSPSHQGLHIWLRGQLPGSRRRKDAIELYDARRSLTLTGWHLAGMPCTIEGRQEELDRFYWSLFREEQMPQPLLVHPPISLNLSDTNLIARAMGARNGARFARLWQGDASDYARSDGTFDWSRADLALCGMLAFWCAGDPERMDRLFRQSGLMRPKWDEQRGTSTYGERTIARAIAGRWGNGALPSQQEPVHAKCLPARKRDEL